VTQHFRESIFARLSLILDAVQPAAPPAPGSRVPSQNYAPSVGAPSVSGQLDLRVGPGGPTLSEQAYESAEGLAKVKQEFGDSCDRPHNEVETAPRASVYCDTCGLNFCDPCDRHQHPAGQAPAHDRHALDYKPVAPKPHEGQGTVTSIAFEALGNPGAGTAGPQAGARPRNTSTTLAVSAAGASGGGGGTSRINTSQLPDYVQLEVQRARMRADKVTGLHAHTEAKKYALERRNSMTRSAEAP